MLSKFCCTACLSVLVHSVVCYSSLEMSVVELFRSCHGLGITSGQRGGSRGSLWFLMPIQPHRSYHKERWRCGGKGGGGGGVTFY